MNVKKYLNRAIIDKVVIYVQVLAIWFFIFFGSWEEKVEKEPYFDNAVVTFNLNYKP